MLESLATRRAASTDVADGDAVEGGATGAEGDDGDEMDGEEAPFLLLDDIRIDEGKNIDLPGVQGSLTGRSSLAARGKERSTRAAYPLIAALLREEAGGDSFHVSGAGCVLHESGALLMRAGLGMGRARCDPVVNFGGSSERDAVFAEEDDGSGRVTWRASDTRLLAMPVNTFLVACAFCIGLTAATRSWHPTLIARQCRLPRHVLRWRTARLAQRALRLVMRSQEPRRCRLGRRAVTKAVLT